MAYFGLAFVGPQSSFLANRLNSYHVGIFERADFEAALQRVLGGAESLPLSKAPAVLDLVFHGPPPPLEAARVGAALEAAAGGRDELPVAEFLEVIAALQAAGAPAVDEDACAHYTSFDQLRACAAGREIMRALSSPAHANRTPSRLLTFPHQPPPSSLPAGGAGAHKLRQVRPVHGPEDVQRAPATLHQEIGFQARKAEYEVPHYVKKCEETKFKSELIKAGVWY